MSAQRILTYSCISIYGVAWGGILWSFNASILFLFLVSLGTIPYFFIRLMKGMVIGLGISCLLYFLILIFPPLFFLYVVWDVASFGIKLLRLARNFSLVLGSGLLYGVLAAVGLGLRSSGIPAHFDSPLWYGLSLPLALFGMGMMWLLLQGYRRLGFSRFTAAIFFIGGIWYLILAIMRQFIPGDGGDDFTSMDSDEVDTGVNYGNDTHHIDHKRSQ